MLKRITIIASLLLVAGNSSVAVGAPASLPLSVMPGVGATNWVVSNTGGTSSGSAFSGICDRTSGFTIETATSADGSSGAYDFAHSMWVNGAIFDAPASVDLTGNTVTAGPVPMWGLDVSMEYAFSDVVQGGRIRARFTNPTFFPIDITVEMPMNSGASPFTIQATSSGDTVFTTADRWVVTSEGDPPNDPVNTTVLWGQRAAVTPSFVTETVFGCGGVDGIGVTFDITIPANSTRQLLFFAGLGDMVGLNNTVTGAITNAAMFDINADIDPSLLAGIPTAELREIMNWQLSTTSAGGGSGGHTACSLGPVTASAWKAGDAWVLLALIAGLGLWRFRHRSGQ